MYIHIYVYIYTFTYVYKYIYICIYTYILFVSKWVRPNKYVYIYMMAEDFIIVRYQDEATSVKWREIPKPRRIGSRFSKKNDQDGSPTGTKSYASPKHHLKLVHKLKVGIYWNSAKTGGEARSPGLFQIFPTLFQRSSFILSLGWKVEKCLKPYPQETTTPTIFLSTKSPVSVDDFTANMLAGLKMRI